MYTQEQRGGEEAVSAHRVSTGALVWLHVDRVRFEEAMGGPGPRATPTVAADRILTFGATGLLNALEAGSGRVIWSRNTVTDLDAATSTWGFAGSPLVVALALDASLNPRSRALLALPGGMWQIVISPDGLGDAQVVAGVRVVDAE